MTPDPLEPILHDLAEARIRLHAAVERAGKAEIYPGWTVKEVAAHIAGWDAVSLPVLAALALNGDPGPAAAPDHDAYNAAFVEPRRAESLEDVLNEAQSLRAQVRSLAAALPPAAWRQPFELPWGGRGNAQEMLQGLAAHEDWHARDAILILRGKNPVRLPHGLEIRRMSEADLNQVAAAFARWHKPRAQFERYLREQSSGERTVMLAAYGGRIAGYATLLQRPEYTLFRDAGVPEITDLNVLTEHQLQGIGAALVAACEELAYSLGARRVGISVVQTSDYAAATHLYTRSGYRPDGRGISPADNQLHLLKTLPTPPTP